jgi:hypothetical protein
VNNTPGAATDEQADMLISVLYGFAVESFIDRARTLSDEQ